MRITPAIHAFLDRLASLQYRRAGTFVAIALLLAAASVPLVRQLGLNSAWDALLPRDKPSVQDIARIEGRGERMGVGCKRLDCQDVLHGTCKEVRFYARHAV